MSKIFQDPTKEFMLLANSFVDDLMPILTPTGFKIVMLIYRNTKGWHKDVDQISFSQIKVGTGIRSSATIAKQLTILVELGVILKAKNDDKWQANYYALNPDFDTANLTPSSKNELGSSSKNELGSSSKNEHTKDTKEIQEIHMPQSGESDFSDIFGNSPQQQPTNGKPRELSETDIAFMQTFGIMPDEETDPAVYGLKQEIQESGWRIHKPEVEMAICYFVLAVRQYHAGFLIPRDEGTRKLWYKQIAGHLQNYSLADLQRLYKQAIIKMRENNLSFWQPGSLTKWALPEVANAEATPKSISNLGDGFYI